MSIQIPQRLLKKESRLVRKISRKANKKATREASKITSRKILPMSFVSVGLLAAMKQVSKLTAEQSSQLSHAANKGLKDTGLYAKGVRVYKISEMSFKSLKKNIKNYAKKVSDSLFKNNKNSINGEKPDFDEVLDNLLDFDKIIKFNKKDEKALEAIKSSIINLSRKESLNELEKSLVDSCAETSAKNMAAQFKLGLNACFLPKANKIITPNKSLQTSVFHEMGHAFNYNANGILKAMQKIGGPLMYIVPPLVLSVSMANKRRTTQRTHKNDSRIQKGKDFVKRNAAKIIAFACAPKLIEEGAASILGGKIGKNLVQEGVLSKEILKKARLTNLFGFATYAIAACTLAFYTHNFIKTKDKLQREYEKEEFKKLQTK